MDFSVYLNKQKQNGLYRRRNVFSGANGVLLKQKDETLLNFCSNDYLGLANDERVISVYKKALDKFGVGSGSSQLVCGYSRPHEELEEALAEFTGREKAVLFSSGYMANLGVQQAMLDRYSGVFLDRLVHASIIDAAKLSSANISRYQHNDMGSLRQMLQQSSLKNKLVVTDSVFSMDGDIAPVKELGELAKEFACRWMLDDAHGFAVLGNSGRGILEHLALGNIKPDIYLATFGKALGTFGAFVAAKSDLVEAMVQRSRSLIYTTAMPPALASATLESLKISQLESWRREKLFALVSRFRSSAEKAGLPLQKSLTPIQPLIVGKASKAVVLSEHLLKKNILVSAIRPPTVPKGSSRLRITFSALHSEEQVDFLSDTLAEFYEKQQH